MNENLFSPNPNFNQNDQPIFDASAFDLGSDPFAAPPPTAVQQTTSEFTAAPQAAPEPAAAPQAAPAPAAAPQAAPAPAAAPQAAPAPAGNVVTFHAPVQEDAESEQNPLMAMMDLQEEKNVQAANSALFSKLPQFSYNGTTEVIENLDQTFEDLRIAKAEDFTELEEASSVTWNVTYGAVSKRVTTPKKAKIGDFKREIESSKAFLDGLKKSTSKNPACVIKPTVSMKPKGIALYKGVCLTLEEAQASDQTISFIPAKDGLVYERRVTEAGEFITPAENVSLLGNVFPGFTPFLPLIPYSLFSQALDLFRYMMDAGINGEPMEALIHIYWDKAESKFLLHVPNQSVAHAVVLPDKGEEPLDSERYVHYADIHSHNDMDAKFSKMDDQDERANRVYMVVGHLENYFPDLSVRICNGGHHWPIPADLILEPPPTEPFPEEWLGHIKLLDRSSAPHLYEQDEDSLWGKAA